MDNAIYTASPKTLTVVVYRRHDDDTIHASTGPVHLVAMGGEVLRTEQAKVVGRGNLLTTGNGDERWYQVELEDGGRHMVIGEGS